jgi:hypothetical protein
MYELVVSACALAVPNRDAQEAALDAYLTWILDWAKLASGGNFRVSHSVHTIAILYDEGAFPIQPHIEALVSRAGAGAYNANDVVATVNHLLHRSGIFWEDVVGLEELLWDEFSPADLCAYHSDGVPSHEDDLARLISMSVWARVTNALESAILVRRACAPAALPISFLLHELQFRGLGAAPATLPARMTSEVTLVDGPLALARTVDITSLWAAATEAESYEQALSLALMVDMEESRGLPAAKFVLRQEFIDTASALGFCHEPAKIRRLMGALVSRIFGRDLGSGHRLRENAAGNSGPQTRGDDTAWRMDIDYEFHVHYWLRADNTIEFACVVVHNDYSIPT